MNHGIQVKLGADIEKYKQSMSSAKTIASDSMGYIASIFDKIKSALGGMWDSFKSFFSNMDKTKTSMGEVDDKSTGLVTKIGVGLVAAFVAATAAISMFIKKGLEADAALAKMSISGDVSAASISRFDDVAARSNMSITEFGGSMGKLHDEMKKAAAGDDAGIFDKLGVKIVDANNALLKTDEVTVEVAKKIAAMSSEAEKYDAAAKVGFAGKVQLLEDIAHAGTLAANASDAQAASVVRLGKIWHEILPGGKSMWADVSTFLSAAFTPSITAASISVLESKNTIVDAFRQIFGAGTGFTKLGNQIKDWAKDASDWFGKVLASVTQTTVGIMQFLAKKTGLGDPSAYKPGAGYVPPAVTLTSGKNDPVAKDAAKKEKEDIEAWTKAIQLKTEAQKLELKSGEALTDGERVQIKLLADLKDGTLVATDAKQVELKRDVAAYIVAEKANAQAKLSKAESEAAAKKEAEAYAHLTAAIVTKTEENRLELLMGENSTESQKNQIKMEQMLAAGKITSASASYQVAQAELARQAASEKMLETAAREKQVMEIIIQSTIARNELKDQLESEYALYGKSNDAREIAMVAIKSEAKYQADLAVVRKTTGGATEDDIKQLQAERDIRTEVGQATMGQGKALAYANQLREENKRFGTDYISDDKARAAAQLAIDADIWRERIQQAGKGTEAQKKLQTEYDVWYQNQSLKPELDAQKKMWESVDATAHDTFISIFDSGKSAFDRLRATLKNGLLDLLYQMTIKKWIFNIGASVTGSAVGGVAQAGTDAAASGMGSAIGSSLGIGGTIGSIGMGAMQTAGAIMTGEIGMGATLSAGMSAIGTGTASGLMAGMSSIVGALGPIALGIGAAVVIWKSLDHGGTNHSGGAAMASSSGVSAIDSTQYGFHLPERNAEADKMTATLASGIVSILDSTALAFGKTAGYTAATAFADDTSKDGAWGALAISKLGEKVLNWKDTQSSFWAPKEFADGEAGKNQYLAALSASVRTALNDIGLPDWAKTMLDGLGASASIEDIAKVADQINRTQKALTMMGDSLVGFSALGDKATSALIAASGGIDSLATNASAYYDAFYSDVEKSASTVKAISDILAAAGVSMPANQAAFRAAVEDQMKLGEAGAPAVAALFKVAGAFAQVNPLIEEANTALRSQADILSEHKDLQKQFNELTMTSVQLAAQKRLDISLENRGLYDQVQLAQKARDARDATKTSLADVIGKMGSFADSARTLRDSLLVGTLSTLTPEQQYAETRRQYEQTKSAALGGDASAQSGYASALTAFLSASQKINGGDSQYGSDFNMGQQDASAMALWASGQVDVAQASLDALNAQVSGILDLNASMLSVAQGIADLPAALSVTPINPANYGGTDSMGLLVTEIKSLNSKIDKQNTIIEGLRADANKNTGTAIVATDKSQQANAESIVTGVSKAIGRAAESNQKVALE